LVECIIKTISCPKEKIEFILDKAFDRIDILDDPSTAGKERGRA
jgi:hypothetical protein